MDQSIETETELREALQERASVAPEAGHYLEHGCVRDTSPLSPSDEETTEHLITAVDAKMKQCFRNAQLAVIVGGDDVQYVKGYVTSSWMPLVERAWIEIDRTVVEITFPDCRPHPPDDAMYFGCEFSSEQVEEAVSVHSEARPLTRRDYSRTV